MPRIIDISVNSYKLNNFIAVLMLITYSVQLTVDDIDQSMLGDIFKKPKLMYKEIQNSKKK